jgi:hypothetical protein
MDFNSFVFPIPAASYTLEDFKGELVWIPKKTHFTYRDKIKYNIEKSPVMRTNSLRIGNNFKKKNEDLDIKILKKKRNYSSIQKIPTISFTFENKFNSNLIKEKITYIPCLFLRNRDRSSNKLILYFHANYEDLGYTYHLCSMIRKSTRMNVLSVEYPGYGIYKSDLECSAENVQMDAEIIYRFLTEILNVDENNIIIMGRCIGSGPAVYLASNFNPASLILISPFKSIKAAVRSIFDNFKFGWLFQNLVKERYFII